MLKNHISNGKGSRKFHPNKLIDILESRILLSASLLKDINPGSGDSGPSQGVYLAGEYLFMANDGADGWQLWSSDGSTVGTSMLVNLNPNRVPSSSSAQLTRIGSEAYFSALSSAGKSEIWKTDGTANGTVLVDTLATGSTASNFVGAGSSVFFTVGGVQEWVTDGTATGTISLGVPGSQYVAPVRFGNDILFRSDNSSNGTSQLWISDGTPG